MVKTEPPEALEIIRQMKPVAKRIRKRRRVPVRIWIIEEKKKCSGLWRPLRGKAYRLRREARKAIKELKFFNEENHCGPLRIRPYQLMEKEKG